MREELNTIELIERYLRGELKADEQLEVENRLKTDQAFREAVELQKTLVSGIKRAALNKLVAKTAKHYQLTKVLKIIGFVALSITLAAAISYSINSSLNKQEQSSLPPLNEEGEELWAEADHNLPAQLFQIDSRRDTVIETESGIVVAIPRQAFTDKEGEAPQGTIELELKEALNPAQIISAGLSTSSNGELLETGGMFYINAKQQGKQLRLKKEKQLLVEIPTDDFKENMLLFEGKRKQDGNINWINPTAIENYLIPTDIHQLNFYPPRFEDTLSAWGLRSDKKFKDSLFYSFACQSSLYQEGTTAVLSEPDSIFDFTVSSNLLESLSYDSATFQDCQGIAPANIKAIWNNQFQNTNLATTAFEERLQELYLLCDKKYFELYVTYIDLPLYKVDSMVAQALEQQGKGADQFWRFYQRKNGRVKTNSPLAQRLSKYYTRKSKQYKEELILLNKKYRAEQQRLNRLAVQKRQEKNVADNKRKSSNFQKEFQFNLKEAYRQLGKKMNPSARYRVSVNTLGWKNVDQYVFASTANRETLDYTDRNGKKAVIRYEEIKAQVMKSDQYDRITTYLVSNQQYSFMKLKHEQGTFSGKLNEFFDYNLICIGYKDGLPHISDTVNVKTGLYSFSLQPTNEKKLQRRINALCKQQSQQDLKEDLLFQVFQANEKIRREKQQANEAFRAKFYSIVFPCSIAFTYPILNPSPAFEIAQQ